MHPLFLLLLITVNNIVLGKKEDELCLGLIYLDKTPHVPVITDTEDLGSLFGRHIYRITDVHLDPPSSHPLASSIEQYLSSGSFFFSPSNTLHLTAQCAIGGHCPKNKDVLDYYLANASMFYNFRAAIKRDSGLKRKYTAVNAIKGNVQFTTATVAVQLEGGGGTGGQRTVIACLISRRSRHRTGPRTLCRGVDSAGHAANHVETELVLVSPDSEGVASLTQVRGTAPFVWEQDFSGWLPGKPPAKWDERDARNAKAFRQHERILHSLYCNAANDGGLLVMLSLLGEEGDEARMANFLQWLWRRTAEKGRARRFIPFNLAREATRPGWQKRLVDGAIGHEALSRIGYFHRHGDKAVKLQNGVVRTSCFTALDRTSLGQMAIFVDRVQYMLRTLFSETGVRMEANKEAMRRFANDIAQLVLADAHALAWQYAGSPAQLTDLGQGKGRTWTGMVHDAAVQCKRYLAGKLEHDQLAKVLDILQ